jgi:carbamoyltransferase
MSVKIISIHYGHNGSVAYLQDGKIKCCISEERFNRIKNSTGLPIQALEYIHKKYGTDINYYVLTQKFSWGYNIIKNNNFQSKTYNQGYVNFNQNKKLSIKSKLFSNIKYKRLRNKARKQVVKEKNNFDSQKEMRAFFSKYLNISQDKILHIDHHLTHALSTAWFNNLKHKKTLVFTLDGEGDALCATVNLFNNNNIQILSKSDRMFSLGLLYREVTAFLGMKPDEH